MDQSDFLHGHPLPHILENVPASSKNAAYATYLFDALVKKPANWALSNFWYGESGGADSEDYGSFDGYDSEGYGSGLETVGREEKLNLMNVVKIVKFSDAAPSNFGTENGHRAKLTEVDQNVMALKSSLKKMDQEIVLLESKIDRLESEARKHVRQKNRTRALQCLRQKKLLEKKIAEKDQVYTNVSNLLYKVEETGDQKQVLDAYKYGVAAFKESLRSHGLSPNEIDTTMDSIHDAMSDHEEITAAISEYGMGARDYGSGDSDVTLEQELEQLLADGQDKRIGQGGDADLEPRNKASKRDLPLPSVPDESPSKTQVRDRLAAMRQELEAL